MKIISAGARLTRAPHGGGVGHFRPDQLQDRRQAQGRWPATGSTYGNRVPVVHVAVHPSGVVDVVGLDYDPQGDNYIRRTNGIPRMFAVGRL